MRHFLAGLALAAALAGCLDPIRPKPPLNVTISAAPLTVTVGQEVNFTINAQGNELLQVIALFGDDAQETVETGGATSARINLTHAYTEAGVFTVTGRAIDGVEGQRDATIQITVE